MKKISIVSPAHNEAKNLPIMIAEVVKVMSAVAGKYEYEYVLVDDGSSDTTWHVLQEECIKNPLVKALRLSRNFGHQLALTAGLDICDGDVVIYCDSDLQHPPEVFKDLIKKWEDGYLVVHTKRIFTEGESFFKKRMSKLFYHLINALSDTVIEEGHADFKLLDRVVLDKLKSMREHNRFLRGMVPWLGFKSCVVEFNARKRLYGMPWYNFRRNLAFAKTGILSFSVKPLKYIGYLGLFLTSVSFVTLLVGLGFSIYFKSWFFSPIVTLSLFNTFLIGFVLVSLGIVSLYISYIYFEVIDRPLYVVSSKTF